MNSCLKYICKLDFQNSMNSFLVHIVQIGQNRTLIPVQSYYLIFIHMLTENTNVFANNRKS